MGFEHQGKRECPSCGSTNIIIGAFPLSCQDCDWHHLNDQPCSVCGKPSRGCAGIGKHVIYGCREHPVSTQPGPAGDFVRELLPDARRDDATKGGG